ncbi:MAG: hypothetical protein PVI06_16025, partial [Desulfobacterales bacterium]
MGAPEDKQDDFAGFQPDILENLTIQDALVISAVYAHEADTEKCERIHVLAQKHPLFDEKPEDTCARVNKFVNWMQSGQTQNAVEAAAQNLKPEQRKQAFEFAAEVALTDKALTDKKKAILHNLAAELALEDDFVDRKLAKIQKKMDDLPDGC